MLALNKQIQLSPSVIREANIADWWGADDLLKIGQEAYLGYTRDKSTRAPWESRMRAAMDLAMQVASAKTFPWQGAANVIFPLVTIAALQFYSRAYPALVQGNEVARYRVYSGSDQKLVDRANRIAKHMSWHLLEGDQCWEESHARLLINIAVVGSAFKKTYYNGNLGMPVSELVMARDLVMDYWAKSVEGAARKTHTILLYPHEVYERAIDDVFLDVRDDAWFTSGARPPYDELSQVDSATRAGLSLLAFPIAKAHSLSSNNTLALTSTETAMPSPTLSPWKRTLVASFESFLESPIQATCRGLMIVLLGRSAASKLTRSSPSTGLFHRQMEVSTISDSAYFSAPSTKPSPPPSTRSSTTARSTTPWEDFSDEALKSGVVYTLLPLGNGSGWIVLGMTSERTWFPSLNEKSMTLLSSFFHS